ncbi:MAG: hypothetical protein IJW55_08180 [Clostridia bacterium]|nr:hypothetical protein [Clostridia bacterium]
MIMMVLILGAIAIIAIFALLAYIVIKLWFAIIKSKEKDNRNIIRSIKKEGYRFLANLVSKDYDIERNEVISRVVILFSVLCIGVLFIWFSIGVSFL